jgi:hypothetical protein
MLGIGVALTLHRVEHRFGAQVMSLPEEISGHVLYLRPFRNEGRDVRRLPDKQAEFNGPGLRNWVALDEFLVRGTGCRLGQVVALGNPAEFAPRGAATRVYLNDDTWTVELARLAYRARISSSSPAGRSRWGGSCSTSPGTACRRSSSS